MKEDYLRAIAMGVGTAGYALLLDWLKAKVGAHRRKTGRYLLESVGYWLGRRWPRGRQRPQ